MGFLRIGTVFLWILCAVSFFLPASSAAVGWARTLFWLLLVVHAVEFMVFYRVLRSTPGSLGHHFLQTMIFGIFHVREVRDSAPRPSAAS